MDLLVNLFAGLSIVIVAFGSIRSSFAGLLDDGARRPRARPLDVSTGA